MDISKYVTNKDIQLSNEDINLEKLEKDIRKGYVLSEEVENVRKEVLNENTVKYTDLENQYNKLQQSYNDIEARNTELIGKTKDLELDVEMISQGFKKENLQEIAALRNSLYKDEEDNAKAISMIKEKYKATYFPEGEKKTIDIPEEPSFNVDDKPIPKPIVTRNTSIKDLKVTIK